MLVLRNRETNMSRATHAWHWLWGQWFLYAYLICGLLMTALRYHLIPQRFLLLQFLHRLVALFLLLGGCSDDITLLLILRPRLFPFALTKSHGLMLVKFMNIDLVQIFVIFSPCLDKIWKEKRLLPWMRELMLTSMLLVARQILLLLDVVMLLIVVALVSCHIVHLRP